MLESILFALAGGALIGLSASLLLALSGRIAGISGIVGGLADPEPHDVPYRLSFLGGLLAGGAVFALFFPGFLVAPTGRSLAMVIVAGLLVGFGTQLGSGCTSGHGICGLPRLSPRSIVAVITFMITGALAATATSLLAGGAA